MTKATSVQTLVDGEKIGLCLRYIPYTPRKRPVVADPGNQKHLRIPGIPGESETDLDVHCGWDAPSQEFEDKVSLSMSGGDNMSNTYPRTTMLLHHQLLG
jgi:hypothetical protein